MLPTCTLKTRTSSSHRKVTHSSRQIVVNHFLESLPRIGYLLELVLMRLSAAAVFAVESFAVRTLPFGLAKTLTWNTFEISRTCAWATILDLRDKGPVTRLYQVVFVKVCDAK